MAEPSKDQTPAGRTVAKRVRAVSVLINRGAGGIERGSEKDPGDLLDKVFRDRGIAATFELVEGAELEERAEHVLNRARRGAIDAIVVGGGDGTINTVAGIVAGSDVAIGILPLGTLNHFARDLGVPLELEEAVSTIASGNIRHVDLGEVNGRIFINNSSIGIYPYMVLDRERRRSRDGLSKWIAMALALLRALRRFPRRRLIVRAEGLVAAYRTPCLLVGNNRYDLDFLSLGRRPELDAGKLFLYVARPTTKPGLLWFLIRAAAGLANRINDLDEFCVAEAEITSRASRLPVALDGEVEILAMPLRYRARPQALKVILPPPAE